MKAQTGWGGRVLLVEDDPALARALAHTLGRHVPITAAPAAEPALRVLEQAPGPFAAVLSDYNLPGRDGLWLLSECRRRWPSLRRLLTSGEAAARFTPALRVGLVQAFFEKPVAMSDLIAALGSGPPASLPPAPERRCRLCRGSGRLVLWTRTERPRLPGLCVACGGGGWTGRP